MQIAACKELGLELDEFLEKGYARNSRRFRFIDAGFKGRLNIGLSFSIFNRNTNLTIDVDVH